MAYELAEERLAVSLSRSSLTFISNGRITAIAFDQITHISKSANDVIIYTGTGVYKTGYTLQELLKELPINQFIRIHRSHIVSFKWIESIKDSKIVMGKLFHVQLSQYYKKSMLANFKKIINQQYFFHEEVFNHV